MGTWSGQHRSGYRMERADFLQSPCRTYGPLAKGSGMSRFTLARIIAMCAEDGDCLIWQRRKHPKKGSPIATEYIDGADRYLSIRRRAYEEYHGVTLTDDQQVSTCGHPGCLAKAHLHVVTVSERVRKTHANMDAATKAKRNKKLAEAAQRMFGKFTPEQVREVRESEEGPYIVARRLGLNGVCASRIKRGESYKDYTATPFAGLGA